MLAKEAYGGKQVNGPVGQNYNGNKQQQKAEKQRRNWIGWKNLRSSS